MYVVLFADREGGEKDASKYASCELFGKEDVFGYRRLPSHCTTGRKLHCRGSLDGVFCPHLLVGKERLQYHTTCQSALSNSPTEPFPNLQSTTGQEMKINIRVYKTRFLGTIESRRAIKSAHILPCYRSLNAGMADTALGSVAKLCGPAQFIS